MSAWLRELIVLQGDKGSVMNEGQGMGFAHSVRASTLLEPINSRLWLGRNHMFSVKPHTVLLM